MVIVIKPAYPLKIGPRMHGGSCRRQAETDIPSRAKSKKGALFLGTNVVLLNEAVSIGNSSVRHLRSYFMIWPVLVDVSGSVGGALL